MASKTLTNQIIALAGIAQASWLADQIATAAPVDPLAMQASIGSILKIDAENVTDVFGGLTGVATGLQLIEEQLANNMQSQQVRYSLQLMQLERQLNKRAEMQREIQLGIVRAQLQAEHFGIVHGNVLASLAELYLKTISTLQPRIMVKGEPRNLADAYNVNKIRSVLLSGIRSAVLWRQCGGGAWKVLLNRKKLLNEVAFLRGQLS